MLPTCEYVFETPDLLPDIVHNSGNITARRIAITSAIPTSSKVSLTLHLRQQSPPVGASPKSPNLVQKTHFCIAARKYQKYANIERSNYRGRARIWNCEKLFRIVDSPAGVQCFNDAKDCRHVDETNNLGPHAVITVAIP